MPLANGFTARTRPSKAKGRKFDSNVGLSEVEQSRKYGKLTKQLG